MGRKMNEVRVAALIILCGIGGFLSTMIVHELYLRGIILDELIAGSITIQEVMVIIMIPWLIAGAIIGIIASM